MNYYNKHIGDYAKDTAYLSLAQDGAYGRMLDLYYAKELPLPLDRRDLYKKLRANSKADREAVDSILKEFFFEQPDGWHKNRCDEEIAKAREEGAEAEAKRENEKERKQRYRERRKELFDELRVHGAVPKWDTSIEQLEAMLANARDGPGTGTGMGTRMGTGTANQEPIANSQEPPKNKAPALPAWIPKEAWEAFVRYRKRKGKGAWTPDAEALNLRKLTQLRDQGQDPQAVLERAVERSWSGLFPIESDKKRSVNGSGRDEKRAATIAGLTGRNEPDDDAKPPIPGTANRVD